MASLQGLEGVAASASARVGEILAEAERLAGEVHADADRAAAATRREAEQEVERIAAETREAARAAARERADRLVALQAALTARGPAVVEGLEGAGATRASLEGMIEALAAAAEQVMAEAEGGDPRAGAGEAHDSVPDEAGEEAEPEPDATTAADAEPDPTGEADDPGPHGAGVEEPDPEPEASAPEDEDPEPAPDPVAAAEDLAKPVADAAPANGDAPANGSGDGAAVTLPDGAPLARKPQRSRERDARFAALLLAVQGRPRDEVDAHLRSEYGFADVEPILDEVFGPAHA